MASSATHQEVSVSKPSGSSITLVKGAIHNPAEPRHFMTIRPADGIFVAKIGEVKLVTSQAALVMHEVAHLIIDPVIYFPASDVHMDLLQHAAAKTSCPLKGEASYYDYVNGDELQANVAWSYREPISLAAAIRGYLAFDPTAVRVERLC